MRFKYNPWVSVVAALLLIAILVLTCTGCVKASAATGHRFSIEYGGGYDGKHAYVLTDTTTGQEYLFVKDGSAAGLVKMEG